MFFLYAYLLLLSILTVFVMSNDPDDFSGIDKLPKICNLMLYVSFLIGWIAPLALGLVEYIVFFRIAMIWCVVLIVVSIITLFSNMFFGLLNLICYGSYLALLISCCNNYKTPSLSPAVESNGRYCYQDRGAYCSPITGNNDVFTVYDESDTSFRAVCFICHNLYSKHFHEQYTQCEFEKKAERDSVFVDYLMPDYFPYLP